MNTAEFEKLMGQCREANDFDLLIAEIPYAHFIGMTYRRLGDETLFLLPPKETNLGNPSLPALHGGVIAGFMEHSAIVFLLMQMDSPRLPKTIDFSIDYLRAGYYRETYTECVLTRLGRRVANVQMTTWQTRRDSPVAVARAHFLLTEPSTEESAKLTS